MGLRYRMLVVDLDGTLLGPDGCVSARNMRAIAEARAAGMQVVVATGRALVEALSFLQVIDHRGLVVAAGGSLLCDAATGCTLRRHSMPREIVEGVTRSLLRHSHKVLILKDAHAAGYDYLAVGEGRLDPASEWWFKTLPVRVRYSRDLSEDAHPEDTVRAGAVARGADLARIAAELREDLGERMMLQHWSAVTADEPTGSETHLLEVFNPNVSKWTMIAQCCLEQGIDPAEVAAIGDEINDLEMIRGAGLGIAMGNAKPTVKQAADRVTESHHRDGLADAVEHILAGRW